MMIRKQEKLAKIEISIILILILSWILLICFHIQRFNSETTEIDKLALSLEPIIPTLINTPKISLGTNVRRKDKLVFQVQFLIAPTLVELNNLQNDTILLLNLHDLEDVNIDDKSFKSIYATSDKTYNINVLVRQ